MSTSLVRRSRRMFREMPRRRWKSSKRVTPRNDVANDEHGPPLADDLETLGDGAVDAGKALAFHGLMVVSCIIERKSVESAGCPR